MKGYKYHRWWLAFDCFCLNRLQTIWLKRLAPRLWCLSLTQWDLKCKCSSGLPSRFFRHELYRSLLNCQQRIWVKTSWNLLKVGQSCNLHTLAVAHTLSLSLVLSLELFGIYSFLFQSLTRTSLNSSKKDAVGCSRIKAAHRIAPFHRLTKDKTGDGQLDKDEFWHFIDSIGGIPNEASSLTHHSSLPYAHPCPSIPSVGNYLILIVRSEKSLAENIFWSWLCRRGSGTRIYQASVCTVFWWLLFKVRWVV